MYIPALFQPNDADEHLQNTNKWIVFGRKYSSTSRVYIIVPFPILFGDCLCTKRSLGRFEISTNYRRNTKNVRFIIPVGLTRLTKTRR